MGYSWLYERLDLMSIHRLFVCPCAQQLDCGWRGEDLSLQRVGIVQVRWRRLLHLDNQQVLVLPNSAEECHFRYSDALWTSSSVEEEIQLFKKALLIALSLDRILILPRFSCHGEELPAILQKNQLPEHSSKSPSDGTSFDVSSFSVNDMSALYQHPQNECTFNAFFCVKQFHSVFHAHYREHISL